jgi:hypothetical protein
VSRDERMKIEVYPKGLAVAAALVALLAVLDWFDVAWHIAVAAVAMMVTVEYFWIFGWPSHKSR